MFQDRHLVELMAWFDSTNPELYKFLSVSLIKMALFLAANFEFPFPRKFLYMHFNIASS